MKKILSIVLVLCMALSAFVLPTFAADGDTTATLPPADADALPIATADDFLKMEATGNYKLTADITLTASYEAGFTGTFDGQGHTVTTSVPMFKDFGGTAKNFTVKGEIAGVAAVAATSTCAAAGSKVVFENIVNDANVTATEHAAGFVAVFGTTGADAADYGVSLEVTNCVNNGNITVNATDKEVGGFVATAYFNKDKKVTTDAGATFTNCTNNGKILSTGGYTGGLFGRPQYTKAGVKLVGCVNNGEVTGYKNTGGLVGHTTNSRFFASYCVNNGDVKSTRTGSGSDRYAGGIIGYAQGIKLADYAVSKGGVANHVEYCLNTGTITGRSNTAGIVAHFGADGAYGLSTAEYCVNIGNIIAEDVNASPSGNVAAGILAYGYGSGTSEYPIVKNCITTGNITMTYTGDAADLKKPGTVSYFIGYVNSPNAEITGNVGVGTITLGSDKETAYAFGWNNKNNFKSLADNKLSKDCEYALTYENAVITKTADAKEGYAWTEADITTLTSGEYVYSFNKGYKAATKATEDALYMTIDGTTFAPTTVKAADGTNAVVKLPDGTFENAKAGSSTPTPATGDDTLVMIAMFVVAALAVVALLPKKRTER